MKGWKTVRIVVLTLMILLILGLIALGVGDHLANRYINNGGIDALNKALPLNGALTYKKVSIHPFRDFPNISIKVWGLEITDSLLTEHGRKPLILEDVYLNTSFTSLRKKQLNIKSVELEGLVLNVLDRTDGYSNIASLIKDRIEDSSKVKTEDGWTIDFDHTDLVIRDIQLNKIDEVRKQKAHLFIDEITIKSKEIDSLYHLNLGVKKLLGSPVAEKTYQQIPLQLNEVKAEVLVNKSFSSFKFLDLALKDGKIDLNTDSQGISNFSEMMGMKKESIGAEKRNSKDIIIDLDGATVSISELDFSLVNELRNRHLEAQIVDLGSEIDLGTDTSALLNLHIDVDQLAFNTDKGAFLSSSIVKGQVKTTYASGSIEISSPELYINKDTFNVNTQLFLDKRSPSTLTIEKWDAITEKIRPLLTDHIQNRIRTYDVKGPMYAKAHIVFTPGVKKARVDLDMDIKNKTVFVKGQVIKKADVTATFINGLYDDSRQYGEDKKNMRFLLHKVSGEVKDFQIETEDALITSSPEEGTRLIAEADVRGKAATASKFLDHDRFYFRKGAFSLSTDINASLANFEDLVAGTNLKLKMKDLEVFYPDGNTILPLSALEMNKEGDKTTFELEGLAVSGGSPIQIQGEVEHLSSVLFPAQEDQLETNASIRANSISWKGLIALFGKDGIISATQNDSARLAKRSMKQTLSGIQESFSPTVDVTIDTVLYGDDVQLFDFRTGLRFEEDRTLVLEKTSFKIDKSNVTLDGEVVINQLDFTRFDFDLELQNLDFDVLLPKFDYFGVHLIRQIHDQPDNLTMHIKLSGELDDNEGLKPESIDAYITYESFAEDKFSGSVSLKANPSTKKIDVVFGHLGQPRNINFLLGLEEYKFDKGWFTISFEFDDNFESFAQMVEESKIGLTIEDAEVYIAEIDVTIPLSRIEVSSTDNNAYYHMLIKSDSLNQELALDGIVKNVRHFAFNDTDDSFEVDLSISSPRIVWDNLKQVMAYGDNGSQQSGKVIKESLSKILRDFNPNVKLKVDQLEYSDKLSFNNIFAHAYMDDGILKIDSAKVAYGNSLIEANIDMDMSQKSLLPFNLNLGLTNIDIAETLEHFDYFNQDELRSAKKIEGNIWLDLDMSAEIDLEKNGYTKSKTDADIKVDLHNLVVEDLQTINDITEKIGKRRRFNTLRFAPIESQITIQGSRIEIEETELQSNAAQAFVEGTIDKSSPENLWISLPIQNLKKPDLENIPDKTGYAATGGKVFLQWVTSESEEDGKTKVRLSKKRFFQERFQGRQFRAYKRELRRERRRLRKK